MAHWDEFDHVIINDDLDAAISALEAILMGGGDASSTSDPDLRDAISRIVG